MKVVALLSGGLDSAAAAKILVDRGDEVIGVTLNLGPSRCCELSIAQRICHRLKIPHYVYNIARRFDAEIIHPYKEKLISGLTPNPCPECNVRIKFRDGLRIAAEIGADAIATGHYARRRFQDGMWQLLEASDLGHSQGYFLSLIDQPILKKTIFPIGELKHEEVHRIGREIGGDFLSNQEICFDSDLEENTGEIVDPDGQVIGYHKGHYFYTIGQRKGMGIGGGAPFYVVSKSAKENKITVGQRDDLYHNLFYVDDIHWIGEKPDLPITGEVRIRYLAEPIEARIEKIEGWYRIKLEKAQFAITPGQLAVINDGEVVLGAGWIRGIDGRR